MRIVAINRRNYRGSQPLRPSEVGPLEKKDFASETSFLRDRGREIAEFIKWMVDTLKIPAPTAEGGGVAVLGWSIGNVTTMAMLRFLPTFPGDIRNVVAKYLQSFIVYGEF